MTVYFAKPLFLLLLLPIIPLVVMTGRKLIGMNPFRKYAIIVTRCILFTILVFALAGLKIARKSDELSVFFLLDESKSIPGEKIRLAIDWINETTMAMKHKDNAGLIVFGSQPSIEANLTKGLTITQVQSHIDETKTDLASALKLCLAAFPENTQKKIVLITDGNENVGDAVDSAYMAEANKAPIYIYPIDITERPDVRIEKMVSPQQSVKDAPFDLKVFLGANVDTEARLRIYEGERLLVEELVSIEAGKKNLYSVRIGSAKSGFQTFRAQLEAPDDLSPENNSAHSFTYVKDVPVVLFVEGNPLSQSILPAMLASEKINIDLIAPESFPDTMDALIAYDCIVFSNVSIDMITYRQMEVVEKANHDFGIGLVVIGGDEAFGPGGYQDTPLEAALPLSMDIRQKKVLPNGALVVVLHTCEIPQGNSWAREIALSALRVLSRKDYYGVLYYGGMGGETWLFKPTMTGNKKVMVKLIRGVNPGDMPTYDRTLQMAYDELMKLNTYVKHIVVISDGDAQQPNQALATKISDSKITISTVVINPHNPRGAQVMAALAKLGKGNFYYPKSANQLPKIFTKEAMIVRKSAIFEKPFFPQYVRYSDILTGFSQEDFPQLFGYVSTTAKDTATVALVTPVKDPLLAMWRYGLGKSVAFTSDATTRWANDWIAWGKFDKFWGQVIRWATRETAGGNYLVSSSSDGDSTTIMLDALDDNGLFINYLQPEAHVVDPNLKTRSMKLTQVSPGKYSVDFKTPKPGNYMMSINVGEKDNPRIVVGGVSVSYSPEYNDTQTNYSLLNEIAQISGGGMITPETDLFLHDPPTVRQPKDIWQFLLAAAIILLILDIFFRRVIFGWEDVKDAYGASIVQLEKLKLKIWRPATVPATVQTTTALLMKRKEILENRELKEQVSSDVLKRIRNVEIGEDDEIDAEVGVGDKSYGKKRQSPSDTAEQEPVDEDVPETFTQQLLKAKKKKKKKSN